MAGAAPPKLVAPPEGLPPGWSAEERFYSEKSQAHGKSYIRFNGPNGRHKGIGSVAKAIELDAVDRGLSVAEELKKWDDIKKRQREDAKVVTPSKQPPEPGDVGRAADARADRAAGRPPKRARASLAPTDGDYVPAPGLAVRSVAAGAAAPRGAPAALALALPRVVEALHLRGFGPDVGLVAVFGEGAGAPRKLDALSGAYFEAPSKMGGRPCYQWVAASEKGLGLLCDAVCLFWNEELLRWQIGSPELSRACYAFAPEDCRHPWEVSKPWQILSDGFGEEEGEQEDGDEEEQE